MKKLILTTIVTLFIITNSYAENWLNHSKIVAGSIEAHTLKEDCERISNEKCYELGACPSSVYSEVTFEGNEISEKSITLDEAKIGSWQAQETVKAQARQKEVGIQIALRKIDCGKRVIALLVLRNATKGLTTSQVAYLNSVYAPIKGLLETASVATAKEQILSVSADGVMITEADKLDLASETQKCIELQ